MGEGTPKAVMGNRSVPTRAYPDYRRKWRVANPPQVANLPHLRLQSVESGQRTRARQVLARPH
jgi:hypothetical protein